MAAPIPEPGNAPEGVFTPPMPEAEKPIDEPSDTDPPSVDITTDDPPPPVDITTDLEVAQWLTPSQAPSPGM